MLDFAQWEPLFEMFVIAQVQGDSAHDIAHIRRVVALTKHLTEQSEANLAITLPAAWLHDCVVVGKSDPLRRQASRLSAQRARAQLINWYYPKQWIEPICHAIEAHSFSADITARTLEAKIVQDADRLDALGAIGIARCFAVGGSLKRFIYQESDPFCLQREPNDQVASLDHFYQKLLALPKTMSSDVGRQEAERRVVFMQAFLDELAHELDHQYLSLLLGQSVKSDA
ncbi:HD domain-containing protein [Celerinatantimonas yamalensis]|uniref:HD domain-containing protein n=1 Tax=Celerinatantimonas yamalensis TaxID=559956 RepID=A0ABW9GBD7_9GAMM